MGRASLGKGDDNICMIVCVCVCVCGLKLGIFNMNLNVYIMHTHVTMSTFVQRRSGQTDGNHDNRRQRDRMRETDETRGPKDKKIKFFFLCSVDVVV